MARAAVLRRSGKRLKKAMPAMPIAEVPNARLVGYALALFYPATLVASCWWSLHGPSQDSPEFSFHPPSHHSKLDDKEYQALPNAMRKHRDNIINQTVNFYTAKPDFDTEHIYDKLAEFEDPISHFKGYTSIACLIHGMPKICTKAEVANLEVEHYNEAISMKFDYTFEMGPYATLEFPILLHLTLNEENSKIVKHQDLWKGRPHYDQLGMVKIPKQINGYIMRIVFGLQTGRLIR